LATGARVTGDSPEAARREKNVTGFLNSTTVQIRRSIKNKVFKTDVQERGKREELKGRRVGDDERRKD